MSTPLNEYSAALIKKILVAGSQNEVKALIDSFLKALENDKKTGGESLHGFVDHSISYLETLNPMNKDASQWSNINMARIHLQHIKRTFEITS